MPRMQRPKNRSKLWKKDFLRICTQEVIHYLEIKAAWEVEEEQKTIARINELLVF
jgi:hypothetical protein